MKKGKSVSQYKVPIFDEAILKPADGERVLVYRTRPNQEFALESLCRQNNIACYLPVRRSLKVHNFSRNGKPYSYSKEVLRPIFSSYIFLKLAPQQVPLIRDATLFARCIPQQYDQEKLLEEIRTVRIIETLGFEQEFEVHSDIPQGSHFLITSGIWSGVRGYLVNKDGVNKWTVEIEFCQQAVTTTIDPTQYKMLPADD